MPNCRQKGAILNFFAKTAAIAAALALSAVPAFAAGEPSPLPNQSSNPGTTHAPSDPGSQPSSTPSPNENSTDNPSSTNSHKLAAPGQYCKAESKKHVAGQSGTPFSVCVKAQAKLPSGSTNSPRTACKAESKKHVDGQKGTPFSLCVAAGAKLLKDQHS
jgi:hypothetical protein